MSRQVRKVCCCPLKISCCLGALAFFTAETGMLPESGLWSFLNFESQEHLQGHFLEYLWIFITSGHLDWMSEVIAVKSFVNNCPCDKRKNAFKRCKMGRQKLRAESGFQFYFQLSNVTFQIHKALSVLVILYLVCLGLISVCIFIIQGETDSGIL